jgi:hypothetical protein
MMVAYSGPLFGDCNATFTFSVRITRLTGLYQTIENPATQTLYNSFNIFQGKVLNMTVGLSDLDGIKNVTAYLVNSFGTRIPVSVTTLLQNQTYLLIWPSTVNSYSGLYTVRIIATDYTGTATTFTTTVTVKEDNLRIAIVSPTPSEPCKVGDMETFLVNATYLSGTPFNGSITISVDGNSYTATKTTNGLWETTVQLTVSGNVTVTAIARSTATMVSATMTMAVSQQTTQTTGQNTTMQLLGSSLPALTVLGACFILLFSIRYSVRKRRTRSRRSESWDLALQYRDILFAEETEED